MAVFDKTFSGSAAIASPPTRSALELADDLSMAVFELKKQLRTYDPNVVEGDLLDLRASFGRIHSLEIEVARAIDVAWHHPNSS